MRTNFTIFLILLPFIVLPEQQDRCPFKNQNSNAIIIGWICDSRTTVQSDSSGIVKTEVGSFKPAAQISNNNISETVGDTISKNHVFGLC
jgi:hypothetical protein